MFIKVNYCEDASKENDKQLINQLFIKRVEKALISRENDVHFNVIFKDGECLRYWMQRSKFNDAFGTSILPYEENSQ